MLIRLNTAFGFRAEFQQVTRLHCRLRFDKRTGESSVLDRTGHLWKRFGPPGAKSFQS